MNLKRLGTTLQILGAFILACKFALIGYILMLLGSILWYNLTDDSELKILQGIFMSINLLGFFASF